MITAHIETYEQAACKEEWARDYNALYDFTPHPHCRITRYRDAVLLKWHAALTERVPEWKAFRKATSETFEWQMAHEEYKAAIAQLDAITATLIDRKLIPAQTKGKAA